MSNDGVADESVQSIPIPPNPTTKSSDEILSELFGAFNATPPPLDDIVLQDDLSVSSKSHKKPKKHCSRKSKKEKEKKRKRSSSYESKSSKSSKKDKRSKKHKKSNSKHNSSDTDSHSSKKKKKKLGKFSASDTDTEDEEEKGEPRKKKKKTSEIKTSKVIKTEKITIKTEKDDRESSKVNDTLSNIPKIIKEEHINETVSKIISNTIDSKNSASGKIDNPLNTESNSTPTSTQIKEELTNDKPVEELPLEVFGCKPPPKIVNEGIKAVSPPQALPVSNVFADDLADSGVLKEASVKPIEDKPKATSGKITIKNLKFSQVYEATVKQIEEEAKLKAEKYEEGEISDSSEENNRSPTPSEISSTESVKEVPIVTEKKHRHHHRKESHRHRQRRLSARSSSNEKHKSLPPKDKSPSKHNRHKDKNDTRSTSRDRSRSRSRDRKKNRSKSRDRTKRKSPDRSRSRDRTRDRRRGRSNSRDRKRDRSKSRDRLKERDRSRSRDRKRARSRSKDRLKERDRSKSKDRKRDRSRSKDRLKDRDRSKSKDRKRDRSRSADRAKDKIRGRSRSRDRVRRKSSERSRSKDKGSQKSKDRSTSRDRKERDKSRDRGRNDKHRHRKERDKRNSVDKIDKQKLLEIARQNVFNMKNPGSVLEQAKVSVTSGGKTVNELTDFCKQLSKKDADGHESISSNTCESSDSESEKPFHHPFQIKDRPSNIVLNIRNSVALPVKSHQEKTAEQSRQLRLQFPVSSGQHHRKTESEWVPVSPKKTEPVTSTTHSTQVAVVKPSKPAKVFKESPTIDIGSLVSQRLNAMRKLQENPTDQEALSQMHYAQRNMQSWAESKQQPPGQFTGSTGVKVLSQAELSAGYQAWARRRRPADLFSRRYSVWPPPPIAVHHVGGHSEYKDQLQVAAPVNSGMGMALLQKMGWRPGEGLGKNKEGTLQPLLLEVKMDKKGLVAQEELPARPPHQVVRGPPRSLEGKHPVSLLNEYCSRRKLGPPVFVLIDEAGPDHKKNFLFKVRVNGVEYKPAVGSPKKKQARSEAAEVCLKALGILPAK